LSGRSCTGTEGVCASWSWTTVLQPLKRFIQHLLPNRGHGQAPTSSLVRSKGRLTPPSAQHQVSHCCEHVCKLHAMPCSAPLAQTCGATTTFFEQRYAPAIALMLICCRILLSMHTFLTRALMFARAKVLPALGVCAAPAAL
jgi:hypothetical protein